MNKKATEILLQNIDTIYTQFQTLSSDDPLWIEVSKVTEVGNIRMVLQDIKKYLETPNESVTTSTLPAIILTQPLFQDLIITVCNKKITSDDITHIAHSYIHSIPKD